jgi:tetratricopeptide (TPR) repeat protein
VEIRRRLLSPDDPLLARSLNNLAVGLQEGGDLTGAERRYREAYEVLTRAGNPGRAQVLMNLSGNLYAQGKYQEALATGREAVETSRTLFGLDNTVTLTAMSSVGWTLSALGDHSEAVRLQRDVAAGMHRMLGDAHPRTAEAWYSLGVMYSGSGATR